GGASVMKEAHCDIANGLAQIGQLQASIVSELSDRRRLNPFRLAQRLKSIPIVGWNCENHSLLRFTDPDFRIGKAGVFQRTLLQPDDRADFFAHFADSGTEATRTT